MIQLTVLGNPDADTTLVLGVGEEVDPPVNPTARKAAGHEVRKAGRGGPCERCISLAIKAAVIGI